MVQRIPLKIIIAVAVVATSSWVCSFIALTAVAEYLFYVAFLAFLGTCFAALGSSQGATHNQRRLGWFLLSTAVMFLCPLSIFCWMSAAIRINDFGRFEVQDPWLVVQAELWWSLAILSPFLAALFLGLGKEQQVNQEELSEALPLTYPRASRPWLSSVLGYVGRLGVSILGSLGFTICLIVVHLLLKRIRI